MSSAAPSIVSVVIATLNRRDFLNTCLNALVRQTASVDEFEVIIVDNGSVDGTKELAEKFCGTRRNVKYVFEPKTGLSVSRNTGVRESRGEIVAFTDDDAAPDPTWVERIASRFGSLSEDMAVLGGEVRPIWETPRPEWLTNELLRPLSAGLLWGPSARPLRREEWLVEVNIAYRKSRLLEFGGFSEKLGRIGDTLLSGESCVNKLIVRAGLGLYYDPEILVSHYIPSTRLTRTWFRRRYLWQGISENRVHNYVEEMSAALNIGASSQYSRSWQEIVLPTSAAAWADLFDDRSKMPFEQQLYFLENLGYLLQSQSLFLGR